jgi:hypothetical protein
VAGKFGKPEEQNLTEFSGEQPSQLLPDGAVIHVKVDCQS